MDVQQAIGCFQDSEPSVKATLDGSLKGSLTVATEAPSLLEKEVHFDDGSKVRVTLVNKHLDVAALEKHLAARRLVLELVNDEVVLLDKEGRSLKEFDKSPIRITTAPKPGVHVAFSYTHGPCKTRWWKLC
ncbi:hypothetical protein WJX72_010334 [[Myrmecia] bisecta]|uniref:Uncharacterized protein n=1 Tax=[Myrmecia] bisecta TaxID=41462 RepID=A0AAW1PZ91_9CHLO